MKSRSEDRRWLQQARKSWLTLAQGALWMGGILGGFLLPPPVGVSAAHERIWLRLGQFVVAVVLGLEMLAARRWQEPRYSLRWAGVALLTLVLAVAAFFRYQELTLAWTAKYNRAKVVIGSDLTPQGRIYVAANPKLSADQLVYDFTGHTDELWTHESIDRRRLLLAATYVSCLPLFTVCLIAVVQTLHSSAPIARRRTRKHPPKTASHELQ
ncbi:MAG: hypothetical protein ABSH48_04610 [Verrucomicrobiota bacterium]|jgi:hypothetical protein